MTVSPIRPPVAGLPILLGGGCQIGPAALMTLRQGGRWPLGAGAGAADLPEMLPQIEAELCPGWTTVSPDQAADGGSVRHFRASRLIAQAVSIALADAGCPAARIAGSRTGFVSASDYGCSDFIDGLRAGFEAEGPRAIRPTDFSVATQGYPMAALTMIWGATGPATAFHGGADSATEALAFADAMLRTGLAERMVVIRYDLLGPASRRHQVARGARPGVESLSVLVLSPAATTAPAAATGPDLAALLAPVPGLSAETHPEEVPA